MKYQPAPSTFFSSNRKRFTDLMEPGAMAVFNSNDEFPKSGDSHFEFKQNADLYFLCGIDQEQTVLVLYPDNPVEHQQELLFIRETNEQLAVWEGNKLTKQQASTLSGIPVSYIRWASELDLLLNPLLNNSLSVYLNTNENDRYVSEVPYRDLRFIQALKLSHPLHRFQRAAPLLRKLRAIKQEPELNFITEAVSITGKAYHRVLQTLRPGIYEFEIEADVTHEFLRNRATGHAYTPIIASGASSCILHYNENDKQCNYGDLLLIDIGAEYGGYNADLSRTLPVNGRYSTRQKQVYGSVLRIFKAARDLLMPGMLLADYRLETDLIAEAEIKALGLIRDGDLGEDGKPGSAFRKFYPHGISHFLGLDVHDLGDRYAVLMPGMVLTCEPGIYIRDEAIGIRLENDIVISQDGNIDLMARFPIEIEEIEDSMKVWRGL